MNIVLQTSERTLVSLSPDEMIGLANALNEVCNGVHIPERHFGTRLGVERSVLVGLLQQLHEQPAKSVCEYQQVDVWAEPASVMLRAISVFGGPVEMSTSETEHLVGQLQNAIKAAS